MEKAVYKGTRKDVAHPKLKHVDTLIDMSFTGISVGSFFVQLTERFKTCNWVICMKGLVIVHILMHEGNGPVFYEYIASNPDIIDMARYRDRTGTKSMEQSRNLKMYSNYLRDKSFAFKATRIDYVHQKTPKGSQIYSKETTDTKFLLLEVTTVQKQLHSLLKCQFETDTLDNDCTFSMFRYCLRDMLKLFQVMNQGAIKSIKAFFEMNETDMQRTLDLYKRFIKITERTNEYLNVVKNFEPLLGFTIPELLHAPLTLVKTLEDHLTLSQKERETALKEIKEYRRKTINNLNTHKSQPKPRYDIPTLRVKPELLSTAKSTKQNTVSNTPKSKDLPPVRKEGDLIDFFSNIGEDINDTKNNNTQGTSATQNLGISTYQTNQTQLDQTLDLLQNRNSVYFPSQNEDIQSPNSPTPPSAPPNFGFTNTNNNIGNMTNMSTMNNTNPDPFAMFDPLKNNNAIISTTNSMNSLSFQNNGGVTDANSGLASNPFRQTMMQNNPMIQQQQNMFNSSINNVGVVPPPMVHANTTNPFASLNNPMVQNSGNNFIEINRVNTTLNTMTSGNDMFLLGSRQDSIDPHSMVRSNTNPFAFSSATTTAPNFGNTNQNNLVQPTTNNFGFGGNMANQQSGNINNTPSNPAMFGTTNGNMNTVAGVSQTRNQTGNANFANFDSFF
ncbi:hypothetical protein BB558_004134 [Smittium angustum]|uniref:ENTH domain-containing protein n=1 Tax=Smittium angustum TaxID=133377 RepID=A0A2U1J426_SMIAN|nr:hypothetical protein BB558_004134 [Smittium angustum]